MYYKKVQLKSTYEEIEPKTAEFPGRMSHLNMKLPSYQTKNSLIIIINNIGNNSA